MTENESEESFTRFISPVALILIGLVMTQLVGPFGGLSATEVTTFGFGLFAVGSFSFVIILNHARNPLATNKVVINAAQALVVYAGVLTVLVYEGIFGLTSMLIAVCVVLVLGTAVATATNFFDVSKESINF